MADIEELDRPASSTRAALRVVVAAPYPTLRAGLRAVVAAEPGFTLAGEAAGPDVLLPIVEEAAADAVVLDPGDDAAHWLAELPASIQHLPPVLMLAGSTELADAAVHAGLRGILLRDATPEEIAAGLRALGAGLVALDPRVLDVLGEHLPPPRQPATGAPGTELSGREREVLALIAQGATNRQIGNALFMAEKTASVHVSRILAKLGVSSRTQAAALAHRQHLT